MADNPPPPSSDKHAQDRLICAGLLGLSIASLSHAAEKPPSHPVDMTMLLCFTAAIPLLATSTLIFSTQARYSDREYEPRFRLVILVFGTLLALVGFNLAFWRVNSTVGLIFSATSLVGFCFWASFQSSIKRMQTKEPNDAGQVTGSAPNASREPGTDPPVAGASRSLDS
jgi:hypothetical protein